MNWAKEVAMRIIEERYELFKEEETIYGNETISY